MLLKKNAQKINDITPLLAHNQNKTESRNSFRLPVPDNSEYEQLLENTVSLLPQIVKGINIISREEKLAGIVDLEFFCVDYNGRPILVRCAPYCTPVSLVEALTTMGAFKDISYRQMLNYPGVNEKLLSMPRLLIFANRYSPGLKRALMPLGSLDVSAYRLFQNDSIFENFDFENGEFKRIDPDYDELSGSKRKKNREKEKASLQLGLDISNEFDEISPLNTPSLFGI